MESIGAGAFFYCIENHVGAVKSNPVKHNSRNNFVYVAVCFKKTYNSAVKSTADCSNDHAGNPAKTKIKRAENAYADTNAILTGSTDVEKSYFICEQNGKRAHDKRSGFNKGVAEVFNLKICF